MEIVSHSIEPPSPCGYLPEQEWRIEYVQVARLSPTEYGALLLGGWRRFGHSLFRPRCPSCDACQSLRIDPLAFRPDRGQKRVRRACQGRVRLDVGPTADTAEAFDLYRRFHDFQAGHRGWPDSHADREDFAEGFLRNPIPTEQWSYRIDGRLVGLGFVDAPPGIGLSAIYFVHDPAFRAFSLGTWNILCLLDETRRRGLPHLYLGYTVAGCPSLAYKARFRPHQIRGQDGTWREPADTATAVDDVTPPPPPRPDPPGPAPTATAGR